MGWVLTDEEILNVTNPCLRGEECPYGMEKEVIEDGSSCAMCEIHEACKAQAKRLVEGLQDYELENTEGKYCLIPTNAWQQLKKDVGL